MRFATHARMNTYATPARLCAYSDRICNRLCTPEALPGVTSTSHWSLLIDYSRTFTTFGKRRGHYDTRSIVRNDTSGSRLSLRRRGVRRLSRETIYLLPVKRYRRQLRTSGIEPEFSPRGERTTRGNQRVYTRRTSNQKLSTTRIIRQK